MRSTDRLGVAVTVAVGLAVIPTLPLTADPAFPGLAWALVLAVAGSAAALRRTRLGPAAVTAGALVVGAAFVAAAAGSAAETAGPDLGQLLAGAVEHIQASAAPMPPQDGVRVLFLTAVAVATVATDLLVITLRRPAWGIVPTAVLFAVPAAILGSDTGLVAFGCLTAGYLVILYTDGVNRAASWTAGVAADSAAPTGQPHAGVTRGTGPTLAQRAAAAVAAPAVAAAVAVGAAMPTLSLLGGVSGWAGPGSTAPLRLADPTLDLRRNLTQPQDRVVITYQTDRPGGVYLRMASLDRFDSSGWRSTAPDLAAGTDLPAIPGVDAEPGPRRRTTISVGDFGSEYLPLPYAPRRVEVPGTWVHDPAALVVAAGAGPGRGDAIRNLRYTVDSVDIAPDPADLAAALPGTPSDAAVTGAVPPDLPLSIADLARRVTAGATTPAGQAAALQAYLRSSRFTYSTEPLPGNGYTALENFLFTDRRGYCEQFAAAMAAMARVLGIPSRVGIGFLPGDRVGDSWQVRIRNIHAWPELSFAGFGWVRFEPTPGQVTGTPPDWTQPPPAPSRPNEQATPTAAPSRPAAPDPAEPSPPPVPGAQPGPRPGPLVAAAVGAGAVAGAAALVGPAAVRAARRRRRLTVDAAAEARAEAAWAELRDTLVDHRGRWPTGSPRTIAGQIGRRLDEPGRQAVGRLAVWIEQTRYGHGIRDETAGGQISGLTRQILTGVSASHGRARRAAARLWPRSLLPAPRRARPSRLRSTSTRPESLR